MKTGRRCHFCKKLHCKQQNFCSRTCSNRSRTNKIKVRCAQCGVVFLKHRTHAARVVQCFCGAVCRDEWQREVVVKICQGCGGRFEVRPSEALKFSTCSKKKCRAKKGKRNPNWRGGVDRGRPERSSKKYKAWRKAVFERDNYTCMECGKRGGYLHADHIKAWAYFPKSRYELTNGRTLCVPCHRKTFKNVFAQRRLAA
jgi:hypothetical protein